MFRPGMAKGPTLISGGPGGGGLLVPTSVPTWFPCIAFTYLDFAAFAALVGDINIYSLVARGTLEGAIIKTSVAFAGPGLTSLNLSVGIVGNLAKFLSPFNVVPAVSASNFATAGELAMESFGVATSIRLAAIAVGANLNTLTAGAGCLYLKGALIG